MGTEGAAHSAAPSPKRPVSSRLDYASMNSGVGEFSTYSAFQVPSPQPPRLRGSLIAFTTGGATDVSTSSKTSAALAVHLILKNVQPSRWTNGFKTVSDPF